jgi:hypothetical protein
LNFNEVFKVEWTNMSQHTSKIFKVVGGCALAVLVIALFMPGERLETIKDTVLRLTGNSGLLCLDYHKSKLKDPESASLISSVVTGRDSVPEVTITYKAKNSFGAFITSTAICTMNSGSVHVKLTELRKSISETSSGLDKELECLDKSIIEHKKNNPLAEVNLKVCRMSAALPK